MSFSLSRRRRAASAALASLLAAAAPPAAAAFAQAPATPPPTPGPPPPVPATPQSPSSAPTPAALPSPLTLAEAIRAALRLQPDIYASAADREAARERLRQTNAAFLPTVTPQYTYNNFTFGGGRNANTPGISNTRETRQGDVSLRYRLYDSGQREANRSQSRASLRAAEFGEEDTRQLVIADVADNYFNVLRNEGLVRVSEAQVTRAQNTFELVRARVQVGEAAAVDIFQAEADLANAQVQLIQARNNADVAQAQLKNSIGIIGRGRLTLADVPAPTPTTPTTATPTAAAAAAASDATTAAAVVPPRTSREAIPPTADIALAGGAGRAESAIDTAIDDFILTAFRTRPDIARTGETINVNRANVRLARIQSGVLVTSDAAAGYQFSPDTGNNREIGAQISYPLFDAGRSRAQVRESQAGVRAAELRLESQRQLVAVEVEQSYRLLSEARARVPAAATAQDAALRNFEAASTRQREGLGTIVEVITAQTQLVQAQTNYVQAIYDFYTADARLARAVGQADRLVAAGR